MATKTTKGGKNPSSKTARSKKSSQPTKPAARKSRATAPARAADVAPDLRWKMIAEAAYLRAERRGFTSGDPVDDWLAAEREVDRRLAKRTHPPAR